MKAFEAQGSVQESQPAKVHRFPGPLIPQSRQLNELQASSFVASFSDSAKWL